MGSHYIIDPYYLTISLLITIAWQCIGFFIAWTLQFDKITDFTGGSNFFILALITLTCGGTYYARNILASVFMMCWAVRLGGFLLFRVLKRGSDSRFDEMRSHFFKFAGFWAGQILWVWVVSLPIVILNSPAISDLSRGGANPRWGKASDIVGDIIFWLGLVIEGVSDIQKYRYKSKQPKSSKPCDVGFWWACRHPPYFGEIMVHWGLWAIAVTPAIYSNTISTGAKRALYASVTAPLFTMVLLLFLSGVPTGEKPTAKRYFLQSHTLSTSGDNRIIPIPSSTAWSDYKHYLNSTSLIIPIPPPIYRPLPKWVKTWVLLDLPMYQFDEEKDGLAALQEKQQEERENA